MSIPLCLSFLITCYYASAQQQSLQCGSVTFSKLSFDTTVRSSLLPAGRLVYVPLEQIIGGDICRLASSTQPLFTYPFTNYQQIVTVCANCTTCSVGLPAIYAYLQRMLADVRVSLVVLVRSTNSHRLMGGTTGGATAGAAGGGGVGTNTVSTESERKVRFAFVDDEMPSKLDDCQIVDVGDGDALRSFSKTSVLFVSISFIILMVISLAWLVFYYVQRFRYAHAKDRLQRRLFNAAKKALTRIPTRCIKTGDKELEADCPVCIDPYHTGDVVRSLPCRHIFHKTCVDPWLLEHRTCPMCKSDILKAFGYHVNVGRRTPVNSHRENPRTVAVTRDADRLSIDVHSTGSDSVLPIQMAVNETSHQRGIYSATIPMSPQIVQVMHCSNRNAFTIVPLTMHNECPSNHAIRDPNQPSSHTAQSDESRMNNRVVTWLPKTTSEHHSLNNHQHRSKSAQTASLPNVRSQSLTQLDLAAPSARNQQDRAQRATNLIAGRVASSYSMRRSKPPTIVPTRTSTEPRVGQPEGIGTLFTASALAPSSAASSSRNNIGDTKVTVRASSARFGHQTTFNRQRVCSLKDNNTRSLNDCMASVESL